MSVGPYDGCVTPTGKNNNSDLSYCCCCCALWVPCHTAAAAAAFLATLRINTLGGRGGVWPYTVRILELQNSPTPQGLHCITVPYRGRTWYIQLSQYYSTAQGIYPLHGRACGDGGGKVNGVSRRGEGEEGGGGRKPSEGYGTSGP